MSQKPSRQCRGRAQPYYNHQHVIEIEQQKVSHTIWREGVPCNLVLAVLTTYSLLEPLLGEMEMKRTQGCATRDDNCA